MNEEKLIINSHYYYYIWGYLTLLQVNSSFFGRFRFMYRFIMNFFLVSIFRKCKVYRADF